jgi:DNA mismatch repair protein MutS2
MEELFGRVEAERRRVELERESLEADRRDLAAATERRRQQADRLRERLQRIRTERAAAAGRLYEEAQAFVRGLKESLEQKAKQAAPQATLGSVREAERELQERARATTRRVRKEPPRRLLPPERITSGEEAWVQKLRAKVRIDRVAGDRVWIDWGGRRFEVGRGDLEELPVEPRPAVTPPKGGFRLPDLTEEPLQRELDLRGCRAAEALEKLDSFLDRARLQNLHQVRIVHGKGTGALKREVERHLAAHPLVASFRTGELGEGSWGVTVATLGPSNESTWR